MTGINDLRDLDNNNTEHYKRIDIKPSLKDENYEVFGTIIRGTQSLDDEFFIKFELYDFNGFYTIIESSNINNSSINIEECYILWMIIGNPSKLSVFSPKNREFQVGYFKKTITLKSAEGSCYHIKTPFPLYQGFGISFKVSYYPPSNYEPINNVKFIEWSYNSIKFQISKSNNIADSDENIELHICVLSSDTNRSLKIDNREEECPLNFIGYLLTDDNLNENLFLEINNQNIIKQQPFMDDNIKLVVSLDFGTTYSGFAYANKSKNEIIINDYWPDQDGPMKTNTALLYDEKYEEIKEWGLSAMAKRRNLRRELKNVSTNIVEYFKLCFLDEENKSNLSLNFNYEQAIIDYLKKIGELIKSTVLKKTRPENSEIDFLRNVLIIFPIPSKLSHQKKAAIRKCMCKAELIESEDSEKLQLITEIEAAAIKCMKIMKEVTGPEGGAIIKESDFLVVNCGGGIVELTLRRLIGDKLVEKSSNSSKLCGSIYIDKEFLEFISKKVGTNAIENLQEKHYDQLQYMVTEFCKEVKLLFTGDKKTYELNLEDICPNIKQYVADSHKDELEKNEWNVEISYEDVKSMFDPIVEQIIQLIREQLNFSKSCSTIFLVGGLSKSKYLQARIEQEFQQHIIVPRQPLTAVVSGALEYGLNAKLIYSRVIDMTYGVGMLQTLHPWNNQKERQNFNKLVAKGTEVYVDQEFEFELELQREYEDQEKFYIELYATAAQDAIFCDAPGVNKVGTIGIDIPESWHDHSINLVLFLGHIEICPFIKNKNEEYFPANFELGI
ncbi:hypothetical protein C1645_755808 [Glomus cerebriforme]|uniref:Hsp70 protein n=1 Tax=Glomus cerebriforme TaxID=658196 RepID=A0A397TI07_9GLOM|nr:hypothetical protein C1645_755808 [Glomus cerebriforme]